jgi:prolyl-tRNA synthetase
MPMGLRVIRKIEAIVREEMNRAGAIEMTMPVIQPAEYWQETGRFEKMGPELLRIKDRHDRDFVVQPTSEEVVTDVARQELRSYKLLPRNLYQIQTKFRDERRPRFGLMRGREFIMKDAYSFDRDEAGAKASYQVMAAAYRRIFDRFGLRYRAVAADSGAIGGDLSEEFQVIAATGEDAIVYCPGSDYAANMEKAEALAPQGRGRRQPIALVRTPTPGRATCADVAELLGVPLTSHGQVAGAGHRRTQRSRRDREVAAVAAAAARRPRHERSQGGQGAGPGQGLPLCHRARDRSALRLQARLPGPDRPEAAGESGGRPRGGGDGRLDLRRQRGRRAPDRRQLGPRPARARPWWPTSATWSRAIPRPTARVLAIERGIEVGHVFYLGTKYSKAMNATFLAEDGKPRHFEMGCYGIGITRLPAAAIEQNHDERGIIWPDAIAPFTVVVCPIGMDRSPEVKAAADNLYMQLLDAGVDVILDDRGERPGAMFADWELIGVPHRITIGDRGPEGRRGRVPAPPRQRRHPPSSWPTCCRS